MEDEHVLDQEMTRRGFIQTVVAGGAAFLFIDKLGLAAAEKTDVWVFHGADKKKLMNACLK